MLEILSILLWLVIGFIFNTFLVLFYYDSFNNKYEKETAKFFIVIASALGPLSIIIFIFSVLSHYIFKFYEKYKNER